jgi:hypothetical protein
MDRSPKKMVRQLSPTKNTKRGSSEDKLKGWKRHGYFIIQLKKNIVIERKLLFTYNLLSILYSSMFFSFFDFFAQCL